VGNQADTDQNSGVIWETVERGAYYAPENIARITRVLGSASASRGSGNLIVVIRKVVPRP
jgi:hypothetical protein